MINLFIQLSSSGNQSILGSIFQLILIAFFLWFFNWQNDTSQIKYSWRTRKTNENIINAYIILSAEMMKGDRGKSKEKLKFIMEYLHKNFPGEYYNFRENLNEAYTKPIKIDSISKWLSSYYFKKKDQMQVIYFLCSLCILDGKFTQKEIASLKLIIKKLKVTDQELDAIIDMYHRNEEEARKNEWRKKEASKIRPSQKRAYCKILGVQESASFKDIKIAYRKLAKLHHPDRFYKASIEKQELAEQRFIAIQEAYEYLEKLMT